MTVLHTGFKRAGRILRRFSAAKVPSAPTGIRKGRAAIDVGEAVLAGQVADVQHLAGPAHHLRVIGRAGRGSRDPLPPGRAHHRGRVEGGGAGGVSEFPGTRIAGAALAMHPA